MSSAYSYPNPRLITPLLKEEEDDEREELEIYPTDNLLIAAKTEDEISQLEIYIYDESKENLYVHHDLMLPNFPLCLEWLDFPPTTSSSSTTHSITNPITPGFGNFIAVGTLDPEIEIWSLDVVDAMYPTSILGRPDETKAHVPTPLGTGKKKRKKQKHRSTEKGYHVGAILGLSWNKSQRNLLASCSADRTVKLWDLSRDPTATGEGSGAIRSFDVHKGEVQAVQWNEKEASVLLTGSYDRTVRTFDSRSPEGGVVAALGSDVEALRWDPWENYSFYVRDRYAYSKTTPKMMIFCRFLSRMDSFLTLMLELFHQVSINLHQLVSHFQRMMVLYLQLTSTHISKAASSQVALIRWSKFGI